MIAIIDYDAQYKVCWEMQMENEPGCCDHTRERADFSCG